MRTCYRYRTDVYCYEVGTRLNLSMTWRDLPGTAFLLPHTGYLDNAQGLKSSSSMPGHVATYHGTSIYAIGKSATRTWKSRLVSKEDWRPLGLVRSPNKLTGQLANAKQTVNGKYKQWFNLTQTFKSILT